MRVSKRGRPPGRREAVRILGAIVVDCHEQSGTVRAAHGAQKTFARMGFQKRSGVAVIGIAFGGDSASFGLRNVFADLGETAGLTVIETAISGFQPGDQRAMYQQIGVAPDGRSEMCIVVQPEPEMPDVLGIVLGLHLAAQNDLVHRALWASPRTRSRMLLKSFGRIILPRVSLTPKPESMSRRSSSFSMDGSS